MYYSQFIINNVNSYNNRHAPHTDNKDVNQLKLTIASDEICSIVKPINTIARNLEEIKMFIKCIKNESLQRFFIALFIKLTSINFVYETTKRLSFRSKIDTLEMNGYKKLKSFVLDLYSLFISSSESIEFVYMNSILYKRIQKIPSVIENDQEFLEKNQEFPHEIRVIKSEHPYNQRASSNSV